MGVLKNSFRKKIFPIVEKLSLSKSGGVKATSVSLDSIPLSRQVDIDIFLPADYDPTQSKRYPVLLFNDGQDMPAVGLRDTLSHLTGKGKIREIIVVAIYAGDRIHEYGTLEMADYKGRGSKASAYSKFVMDELLPYLEKTYQVDTSKNKLGYAGFSLGGLSAFNIAWNFADRFELAGVFSGSFWWRSRPSQPADPDAHRILHDLLRNSKKRPELKFWFQTGTKDETDDRNHNGIIDSIDDTLDLIEELKRLGYRDGRDIRYVEVLHGEHNPHTWGKILPDFLTWAYGKSRQ